MLGNFLKEQVRQVTGGLTVSIGIAPNKFVAKIASDIDKPNGLVVVQPQDVLDFIGPLPVSRLWGVIPRPSTNYTSSDSTKSRIRTATAERLASLGMFADNFNFSMGIDERAVSNVRIRKSIGSEMTLPQDTWLEPGCFTWLESTAVQLATELTRKNLACGGVRFKLKTPNHQVQTRQVKLMQPTQEWSRIFGAAQQLVIPFFGHTKVRLVGLSVYNLTEPSTQLSFSL